MEPNSNTDKEISFKEKRIRDITIIYYSRPDIKKAIYNFSKNRETIPQYFEGFGKRPDNFQYESDISEHIRRGATSFHCSEEIWDDPLEISTDFSEQEYNNIRIGWDLLLDIDSPYLEYSKIYADLLIKSLKSHGIDNCGIKFSGSKGFHIIVPWKAFPEEVYGTKTKDMFPEWPRIICQYLSEILQPKLAELIFKDQTLKELAKKTGKEEKDLTINECLSCNRPSDKKYLVTWVCSHCKSIGELIRIEKTKRSPKCPECRRELIEQSRKEILACNYCNIDSIKNPEMFGETREKTESFIEADLILVAPRHLFRMPYSLHEKTALSSIVLNKDKIKDFQITDAKPHKVKIKSFYPEPRINEAKDLLLQSLDWKEQKDKKENSIKQNKVPITNSPPPKNKSNYKQIVIPNPTNEMFPPCIKSILNGVKQDGRKRALFILINLFKSLGVSDIDIEKRIEEWNKKNYNPLKKGYIMSQLNWYKRVGARLPPNCNNPAYKDIGVCNPDELCREIKNPLNYTIKKFFQNRK